ncbi:CRTAC1 family protein [Rubripirellula tenax]|nr:CRTAC1 family protein [Rubripirellula tenax]
MQTIIFVRRSFVVRALCILAFALLVASANGCSSKDNQRRSNTDDPVAERKSKPAPIITPPKNTAGPEPGHAAMVKRLARLHEKVADLEYFGDSAKRAAAKRVDASTKDGDFFGRLQSLFELGSEQTLTGEADAALATLALTDPMLIEFAEKTPSGVPNDLQTAIYFAKALAAMRKAENENCVFCQEGEGCLFPIRGKGVHLQTEGATIAIENLNAALELAPNDVACRWLLCVAHMTLGTYPDGVPERFRIPADRLVSDEPDFPRFRNIATAVGVDTLSLAGGVAVEDFNGDHWLDIIVSCWNTDGQLRMFQNMGNGEFKETTEQANLVGIFGGLNINQADYDGDGDVDILVLRGAWLRDSGRHPNSLLRNDGTGRFDDVTVEAGLADENYPTQTAAWSDFDNDGDLDVYIGNELHANQLFQNDGDGHFVDIAKAAGVDNRDFTKGVAWGDYDADGLPDLYVSNNTQPNVLYHNDGDGRFTDVTKSAGVAGPLPSFSAWFWDFNNDGKLDLFAPHYQEGIEFVALDYFGLPSEAPPDALYQGDGAGGFTDVTRDVGLGNITVTMGSNYGDLDNDGFLDFYLGTGYPGFEGLMPNVMYHNRGGKRFTDVSIPGGFSHLQKGHAVAFADFDHDGDQDVFTELGGAYTGDAFRNALFMNPGFGNEWIKLRLVGKQSIRSAVGAHIHLSFRDDGETRHIHRWVNTGSSFGGNPLRQDIGVGKAKVIDTIEIDWPASGTHQTFHDVPTGQFLIIEEFSETPQPVECKPFFFDVE